MSIELKKKSVNIGQLAKLMLDNQNDLLNVDRDYQSHSVRAQARMALLCEQKILKEAWQKLTGKVELNVAEVQRPPDDAPPGDDGHKEPVHA
jgi:hypothetical protein